MGPARSTSSTTSTTVSTGRRAEVDSFMQASYFEQCEMGKANGFELVCAGAPGPWQCLRTALRDLRSRDVFSTHDIFFSNAPVPRRTLDLSATWREQLVPAMFLRLWAR